MTVTLKQQQKKEGGGEQWLGRRTPAIISKKLMKNNKNNKEDFIHMVKLRILRWKDYTGLSVWALNLSQMYWTKGERKRFDRDKGIQGNGTMDTEIGMMQPHGKKYWQPPEMEEARVSLSPGASGRSAALITHDFSSIKLISLSWLPELGGNKFLLFMLQNFCKFVTAATGYYGWL